MHSFPNQRKVTIHKPKCESNFLQVAKDDWMEAYQRLNRGAFGLYLYMCGNMDGYGLYLSSADVQKTLGVSDSTYRRAVTALLEEGYLITGHNEHILHFYTTPQPTDYVKKEKKKPSPAVMDEKETAVAPVIYDNAPVKPPEMPEPPRMAYHPRSLYEWED